MASGCGPGTVGDAIRPEEASAADALGEDGKPACRAVAAYGEPLIVDWKSTERLDLELAMKEGVAVVAYTCDSFKLLKRCKIEGSYEFAAVSRKEDVVQLTSKDEVAANLPFSAGKVGASMERGSTIDMALVMVGKKGTTVDRAARPQLTGDCEGATHFVHAAFVGAFAVAKGTSGKVQGVAELFGAGTSAASASDKQVSNKDGDLKACRTAKSTDAEPPDQCQSALRVELMPITAKLPEKAAATSNAIVNPCPDGMVRSAGKCAMPAAETAHLCKPDDAEECVTQCQRGDAGSCYHLAWLHRSGKGVDKDLGQALSLFEKACEGDSAKACSQVADEKLRARLREKDPTKVTELTRQAEQLLDKACQLGDGWVCWNTASWYMRSPKTNPVFGSDYARGVTLIERGCKLGYGPSCSSLAALKIKGEHTPKDAAAGLTLYKKACDAGRWQDCEKMADVLAAGRGVKKDPTRALAMYERACSFHGLRACNSGGELLLEGKGVPKDAAKARALFEQGCPEKGSVGWDACESLAELYDEGTGVTKDRARAAELYVKAGKTFKGGQRYEKGDGVTKDLDKAMASYDRGCRKFSRDDAQKSCDALGRLLEQVDEERAKKHYADLCERMRHQPSCAKAKRLGGKSQ